MRLRRAVRHGVRLRALPVRDSKLPTGPVLAVPAAAFSAFVEGVKGGQLSA
ncbi:DUF397 domain-containing protein [Streptomyces sp. adm13(2018)]|uniref:DUF397 domain-containing protein n=1 Tax=unclassified Streptomyces TaxID=2593676 RepID=UPI0011CEA5CD|nr:DUF397 domain-containing protein [Streptomyces sp. adm13(2018)]